MKIDEHLLVNATNKAFDEFLRQKRQGIPRDIDRAESESKRQQIDQETKPDSSNVYPFSDLTDQYQERDVIRILLNYGDQTLPDTTLTPLARFMIHSLSDILDDFQHPLYKKIIDIYRNFLDDDKVPVQSYFTNHPDPEIQKLAIELLTHPYEYASWEEHDIPLQVQLHPDDNFKKDANNAILRLKLKMVMDQIEENRRKIDEIQSEGNDEDLAIHIRLHYDLLNIREQITAQFKSVVLKV